MENGKPHCQESERGVLGSMLLDPQRVIPKMQLSDSDFYVVRHQLLYQVLKKMYVNNEVIDSLTIRNYLNDKKLLDDITGEYLLELQDTAIISCHAQAYESRVKELSELRFQSDVMETGIRMINDGKSCTDFIMSSLIRKTTDNKQQSIYELGEEWIDKVASGNTGHLNWWCAEWDSYLTKLSSEVCIIHAPRSTGKTAWLLQYICYLHQQGLKCSFASIEMIKQELLPRLIAHLGQVNTYTMRTRGFITENEKIKSQQANVQLKDLNLRVKDGSMNIMQLRAWALSEKKQGADAIFIDNLLCINDGGRNYVNRTAMYDYFIQQIIDLRNDIKIPIFLLAHPNADQGISYSKNIENLCDIIVYLHTVPNEGIDVNGCTIEQRYDICGDHVVAKFQKNRQGLSPVASLEFDKNTQTFKHLAWE